MLLLAIPLVGGWKPVANGCFVCLSCVCSWNTATKQLREKDKRTSFSLLFSFVFLCNTNIRSFHCKPYCFVQLFIYICELHIRMEIRKKAKHKHFLKEWEKWFCLIKFQCNAKKNWVWRKEKKSAENYYFESCNSLRMCLI